MSGFEALQQLRLPDAWQAEAIRALAAGDDVIVQAPTGAGKTFIFEQYFQQRRGSEGRQFTRCQRGHWRMTSSRNGRGSAGGWGSPRAMFHTMSMRR